MRGIGPGHEAKKGAVGTYGTYGIYFVVLGLPFRAAQMQDSAIYEDGIRRRDFAKPIGFSICIRHIQTLPTMTPSIAILGAGPGGLELGRLLEIANIAFVNFERDESAIAAATGRGGTLDIHADSGQVALQRLAYWTNSNQSRATMRQSRLLMRRAKFTLVSGRRVVIQPNRRSTVRIYEPSY